MKILWGSGALLFLSRFGQVWILSLTYVTWCGCGNWMPPDCVHCEADQAWHLLHLKCHLEPVCSKLMERTHQVLFILCLLILSCIPCSFSGQPCTKGADLCKLYFQNMWLARFLFIYAVEEIGKRSECSRREKPGKFSPCLFTLGSISKNGSISSMALAFTRNPHYTPHLYVRSDHNTPSFSFFSPSRLAPPYSCWHGVSWYFPIFFSSSNPFRTNSQC
jgi:hypothetical protein